MFKEVRRVVWYHILKHYGSGTCTATAATTPLLQLQLATLSGNRLKVPGAFDQTHTRKDNEMKIYFKKIYIHFFEHMYPGSNNSDSAQQLHTYICCMLSC